MGHGKEVKARQRAIMGEVLTKTEKSVIEYAESIKKKDRNLEFKRGERISLK